MPEFTSVKGKWIPKGAAPKVEAKLDSVPEAPKEEVKKEEPKVARPSGRAKKDDK
jgi:hypothetical protein